MLNQGGQLEFLRPQGSEEGQGFYFSRPVVAERVANLFKVGIHSGHARAEFAI